MDCAPSMAQATNCLIDRYSRPDHRVASVRIQQVDRCSVPQSECESRTHLMRFQKTGLVVTERIEPRGLSKRPGSGSRPPPSEAEWEMTPLSSTFNSQLSSALSRRFQRTSWSHDLPLLAADTRSQRPVAELSFQTLDQNWELVHAGFRVRGRSTPVPACSSPFFIGFRRLPSV